MVVSLGEALIDFVSQKGLSFDGFPGGSPYNTAVAISRLGTECQFLGRVGKDLFGEQLLDYLKINSVGTGLVVRTDDKSTLSFVRKQKDGQAQYAFFSNDTADRNWTGGELDSINIPESARIIHFGSISLSQEPGGTQIELFLKKQAGKMMLSFDPNIRPSLVQQRDKYMKRFTDLCGISEVVKLSDEDLQWLYPELNTETALDKLIKLGPSLIALTVGSEGALIINNKHRVIVPIIKGVISDTIGAGDTFHGALLNYLHKNKWFTREKLNQLTFGELKALGSYANKAAGINCTRPGADPPTDLEMG